jgi:O-antigen/teichoic acid export membrane protein
MTAAEGPSLIRQVRSGLGWSFANNIVTRAGTLIVGIVLARILLPRDYGVFAVAFVAMQFLLSLNDIGMTAAIVRWPGDLGELAPTASTVILAMSLALYGAFFVAAPHVASVLKVPDAAGVLRLLTFALVIDGAFAVPTALLTRSFLQGRRAVADVANLAVASAVSIVLAARGHGAWSLAWGRVAGNATSGVLIFLFSPTRVWPGFRSKQARELLAFGLPLAGSSFLLFAMLNVDYVVVGRVLGPIELGFYLMAFNLSSWPVDMFSFAVRRVALAAFARLIDDPPRLRRAFTRSLASLLAVTTPICVLLSALGLPLIRFVYGSRWAPAARALQLLAFLGLFRIALDLAYDLLVAVGRSKAVLWLQLLWVVTLVPALIVGARIGGIRGVGVGHVGVAALIVAPGFLIALGTLGVSPRAVARSVTRPAVAGVLAGGIAVALAHALSRDISRLILGGAAALAAAGLVLLPMRRQREGPAELPTLPAAGSRTTEPAAAQRS